MSDEGLRTTELSWVPDILAGCHVRLHVYILYSKTLGRIHRNAGCRLQHFHPTVEVASGPKTVLFVGRMQR